MKLRAIHHINYITKLQINICFGKSASGKRSFLWSPLTVGAMGAEHGEECISAY